MVFRSISYFSNRIIFDTHDLEKKSSKEMENNGNGYQI